MWRRKSPSFLWKGAGNQGAVGCWGAMELVGLWRGSPMSFLGGKKSTCSPLYQTTDFMFIAAAAECGRGVRKGFYPLPVPWVAERRQSPPRTPSAVAPCTGRHSPPPPLFWRVAIVSTPTSFHLITLLRTNWGPLVLKDSFGGWEGLDLLSFYS